MLQKFKNLGIITMGTLINGVATASLYAGGTSTGTGGGDTASSSEFKDVAGLSGGSAKTFLNMINALLDTNTFTGKAYVLIAGILILVSVFLGAKSFLIHSDEQRQETSFMSILKMAGWGIFGLIMIWFRWWVKNNAS